MCMCVGMGVGVLLLSLYILCTSLRMKGDSYITVPSSKAEGKNLRVRLFLGLLSFPPPPLSLFIA